MAISAKHIISTPIGRAQVFANSATAINFCIDTDDSGDWAVVNRVSYRVSLYLRYENSEWRVSSPSSLIYKVGSTSSYEATPSARRKIHAAAVDVVTQWANENQDLLRKTECDDLKEDIARLDAKKKKLLSEVEQVNEQIHDLLNKLNKLDPQPES